MSSLSPLTHRLAAFLTGRAALALYEPTTALTDLALGGQTLTYAVLLRRSLDARHRATRLWTVALGAAGVAGLAGSLHHATFPDVAPGIFTRSWDVVGLATGVASAAMLAAGVYAVVAPRWRLWWLTGIVGKAVVFGALNFVNDNFRFIIYDYASSMLLLLALMVSVRRRNRGADWIIAGIVISFIAAGIQMSGFTLHKYFNHNDLYHVVQMIAFHAFYTGVRRDGRDLGARN
jgi:hypothetical protein